MRNDISHNQNDEPKLTSASITIIFLDTYILLDRVRSPVLGGRQFKERMTQSLVDNQCRKRGYSKVKILEKARRKSSRYFTGKLIKKKSVKIEDHVRPEGKWHLKIYIVLLFSFYKSINTMQNNRCNGESLLKYPSIHL